MKPWRKRHAGRAFTSDAPVSFKKQRTGFVGGGSAEMATKTREIMKYANPQLSAVLDAVAPVATVPAATDAKATHAAPVLQSFDSSAAVIVHDGDDKKNSAAAAPAADAKTPPAAPVLQSFDSSAAVVVHDDDKTDKKGGAKPDLLSQIQSGKKLKKAPKPDAKTQKPDAKAAGGGLGALQSALSKKFAGAGGGGTVGGDKMTELKEKAAEYKANKTPALEAKLRARKDKLADMIKDLKKEIKDAEDTWGDDLDDDDGHQAKVKKLQRLKSRKSIIDEALA